MAQKNVMTEIVVTEMAAVRSVSTKPVVAVITSFSLPSMKRVMTAIREAAMDAAQHANVRCRRRLARAATMS